MPSYSSGRWVARRLIHEFRFINSETRGSAVSLPRIIGWRRDEPIQISCSVIIGWYYPGNRPHNAEGQNGCRLGLWSRS